ncbi:MAG: EpsI family protein [Myxococcota bacterium]|jgi:EpsI family protein|nr:EpsI family protein [Myxococcota bacterium]
MTVAKLIVALLFIAINSYAYNNLAQGDIIPEREVFANFPNDIDGWACKKRGTMEQDVLDNLGVTDYLICRFRETEGSRRHVDFYAGYHEKQERSDSGKTTLIHPPEHCLPGSGWDIIESSIVPIDFGIAGDAKRVVIAKGKARALVYFWYQSRGHVIGTNFGRLRHLFFDRALRNRTDGSLLRFTMPVERDNFDEADETFRAFASRIAGDLPRYIPN